jgi:hypothetical protein
MDGSLNFVLTVRSRSKNYDVDPPTIASLENILAKAAQDPPVMIPRRMGVAFD